MTIRRATKADLDTIRSLWEAMEEELGGPEWVREIRDRVHHGEFGRWQLLHGSYLQDWMLAETATSQADVMRLREELDKLLADWTKAFDEAMKLAVKVPRVEKALILSDAAFKTSRAAMWAYFARGGEERLKRARSAVDEATNTLPDGVGRVTD